MTYKSFVAGVDESIRRGDIKPIWARTMRSKAYRELLRRLDAVEGA